jgi:hypothetical protein
MLVTGTTQVTVFDQDGKLRDEHQVIAREVKKRIERHGGGSQHRQIEIVPKEPEVLCTPSQTIMWPEDFNVVRMTMKTEKSKSEEADIRIKFISSAENMPDLLNVMTKKAGMGRKGSS